MKISIRNIAKLKEADVEINGITVIAGPNNTGKSTVGKALFSVFNSFYNIKNTVDNEKEFKIADILYDMFEVYDKKDFDRSKVILLACILMKSYQLGNFNDEELFEIMYENIIDFDEMLDYLIEKEDINKYISYIIDILRISDDTFVSKRIYRKLYYSFDGQISNINNNDEGKISLKVKNKTVHISIEQDSITFVDNLINIKTESIYFDNPFILDDYNSVMSIEILNEYNHRTHLFTKIFSSNGSKSLIDEIITEEKLATVYEKINSIGVGEMIQEKDSQAYREKHSQGSLRLKNLSSGLKTFIIIKKLLQNGSIEKNGTLILDEPEIHLHPEWQLVFAEIIVLLQKTFGLHILLNTHSPYFLRAIQVYAAKHEIADMCKYYLSRVDGHDAYIDDVTEDTEQIFASLARPFQILENEKWNIDED